MGRSSTWDPWRELRARGHLTLRFARLTGCDEVIADLPGGRTVFLDSRLNQRARNALLAHSLIHDERQLFPPGTPAGIVQREEELVTRETARRLVPLDQLREFVDRIVGMGEAVHALDVCDHFAVPLDLAHKALFLLEQQGR